VDRQARNAAWDIDKDTDDRRGISNELYGMNPPQDDEETNHVP